MAKIGSVDVQGLETLSRAFSSLGDALPAAMQAALDDVAETAVTAMAPRFNSSIEGGPAPFTKIVPGSKRSSVVTSTRRKSPKGDPEASIRVQKLQSSYLKFHLDDETGNREIERPAGDVGVASAFNLTPNRRNLGRWQGIQLTPQGNLPRGAIRKLVRRSRTSAQVRQDNEDRSRRSVAKKLGLSEKDPQVDAIMAAKKIRGRKRKPGGRDDAFWGVPKGRHESKLGFWQRPVDPSYRLIGLVHAEEKSRYPASSGAAMQSAWNDGIEKAMQRASDLALKRLDEAAGKASAKGGGGDVPAFLRR